MAKFKYLGEPKPEFVDEMGPSLEFRIPKKDGTRLVLTAADPARGWIAGDILPDITDERSVRVLRADARFEEVQ
jgi:hypothetical protein